jgi:transcriptional regulator with XRE-family HTH domain
MSTVHDMAIVTACEMARLPPMSTSETDIKKRLDATREALGLSAAEMSRRLKIGQNAWSQYVNPKEKRKVTLAVANKLCDEFRVTLDWIYRGDPSGLPERLIKALRRQEAA